MKLREELEKRGLVYQFTDEKLFDLYEKWGQKFYCGFDPTADSLQLGNFVSFMTAVNFMKRKNTFVLIIWWATGMIGDPSFKATDRAMLDEKTLRHNQQAITKQVQTILENLKTISWYDFKFEVINNYDFYKDMSIFEFLSSAGKYITVNNMLSKESVKKRIEDPEMSITYTEFSYMLLQGYDFLTLYEKHKVKLQIGWSDQRGNMVTGTEMIRKKLGGEAQSFVMTFPLITDSTGKKFWKSEGNAIFLDPNKTSPYFAYQYFMNTTDEDVEKYLKIFTLLDFDTVEEIVNKHKQDPSLRYGQKQLANYLISTVYGEEAAAQSIKISEILFGQNDKLATIKTMSKYDLLALQKETGGINITIQNSEFIIQDWNIPASKELKVLDLFTQSGLTESNGEAKKLLASGALYCNENKVIDLQHIVKKEDFINGALLLRKGKKQYKLIIYKV